LPDDEEAEALASEEILILETSDDTDDDAETEPLPPVKAKPASKKSAAPKKAPVVDDDDEDDDEDDEDDDYEPPPPPSRSAKKPASKKAPAPVPSRRNPRPASALPAETAIDAPKKETLYMLGALAVAICAMWGASRFACNAHPMQTRKPRDVSVGDLARDPKGAALELAQRWAGYDFAGALEVAKGPLAEQIKKDQASCEQDKSGCEKKREEAATQALASVVLVSREAQRARARVSSQGGATGNETYVLELELDGAMWKATSKGPDTGPPPAGPAPAPPPAPAPTGSQ
jgi:hypothetical protein